MASRKRFLYCFGVTMVGPPGFEDLPRRATCQEGRGEQARRGDVPRKALSLTQLSSTLSHV